MFSSNQVFEISGEYDQLESALRFALKHHGDGDGKELFYQITEDGKYCIGWYEGKGWNKYPFDFNPHIVSEIIEQHLRKLPKDKESEYEWCDGCTARGFLMKVIDETFSSEMNGIKDPFYGIVSVEPFECFFSK